MLFSLQFLAESLCETSLCEGTLVPAPTFSVYYGFCSRGEQCRKQTYSRELWDAFTKLVTTERLTDLARRMGIGFRDGHAQTQGSICWLYTRTCAEQ